MNLKPNALNAALICACKEDIRYYLNGVYIRYCKATNELLYAGTNGHVLFLFFANYEYEPNWQNDFEIIIPYNTVINALKMHKQQYKRSAGNIDIKLETISQSKYLLGDVVFKPLEGKYPSIEKVIPTNPTGIKSNFNPTLLMLGKKAFSALWGKDTNAKLIHNGGEHEAAGIMTHEGIPNTYVCIMPMREKDEKPTVINLPQMFKLALQNTEQSEKAA